MFFFSFYTDAFEKRANKLLRQLSKSEHLPKKALHALMQEDLLRLSVWMEYKYKGYKNLSKRVRKKLYKRADALRGEFRIFLTQNREGLQKKQAQMKGPDSLKKDPQFLTILAIMDFLKPGEHFNYREGAALEKMLQKPRKGLPEADCNQLTTLYIALFASRHPIEDLQIKLLPEHVCLHYKGMDIETTNATLAEYKEYEFLSPVEEILATNLLDVPDPTVKRFKPSSHTLIQAAHLAFQLSSHRKTVEKNLEITYHNLVIQCLKDHDFKQALLYAQKTGKSDLKRHVMEGEAWHSLKKGQLKKAETLFYRLGDQNGLKACLQQALNLNLDKIKSCKTVNDYKKHKRTLKKVLELAQKTKSHKIEEFARKVLKEI